MTIDKNSNLWHECRKEAAEGVGRSSDSSIQNKQQKIEDFAGELYRKRLGVSD